MSKQPAICATRITYKNNTNHKNNLLKLISHQIIFITFLAAATAAPTYILAKDPHVYHTLPLTSKSTYTQSSQVIDHGSTLVHAPVVQHVPLAHTKSTITKANQVLTTVVLQYCIQWILMRLCPCMKFTIFLQTPHSLKVIRW